METLLVKMLPVMKQHTNLDLIPTYSYARAYKKGDKLEDIGDMLVYSGCELEHWREPFEGNICGQVFLHYNHVNGPFAEKNKFDKRPMLGLPSFVKLYYNTNYAIK
jgi:hypothetical protein